VIAVLCRAAMLAAFVAVAGFPLKAQQQDQAAQDAGGYKPPARLIAREEPAPFGGAPSPQALAARTAQKSIGLITTIGDSFHVRTIGVTVFGNEAGKFPIASWKVNDRVASSVANLLRKNFRVKRIAANESTFASLDAPGRLFRSYDDDFNEIVRKLATSQTADYYLVITPGGSAFSSTNQSLHGLGVTRTFGLLGGGGGDYVHALTVLRVYDGQFKLLRTEAGTMGEEGLFATVKGPHLLLEDDKRLPKEPEAAAKDPRARQIALDLLDRSLAMTVPKLFARD
jgi:hypothetical protein